MAFFKKKDNKIKFDDNPINFNNYTSLGKEDYNPIVFQVMQNDGVNICAEACACCWDTKLPTRYSEKATYISKRTKIGHGSVTEHSNHVFYMEVDDADIITLAEFLSKCKYVYTSYKHSKKYAKGYLVIGGSWRAFDDIIKKHNAIDMNNSILSRLMTAIYAYINSCGMADLIENEIIEDNFDNTEWVDSDKEPYCSHKHESISEKIEIINVDNMDSLIKNIQFVCPEPELFTTYDLLDMCTITILFKNMSRIITQQLTRHRNGITQESQRYVNYSKGGFNSPALFKSKYDPNYKYSVQFGKSSQKMTLQEIGEAEAAIYGQLTDKDKTQNHDLQLEDARGFLPNNIQCGKIYITFTWRTFFQFLFLREDLHAQVEIREFAKTIGEWFRKEYANYEDLYDALTPLSINTSHYANFIGTDESINVDETMSTEEMYEKLNDQIINQEKAEALQ